VIGLFGKVVPISLIVAIFLRLLALSLLGFFLNSIKDLAAAIAVAIARSHTPALLQLHLGKSLEAIEETEERVVIPHAWDL